MNYPPPYQSIDVLAAHLCVSETTIENWVKIGLLPPPKRIGGKRLWRWKEVDKAIAGDSPATLASPERIRDATRAARQSEGPDLCRRDPAISE